MVKYNFSFNEDELTLIFLAFYIFRREYSLHSISQEIDEFMEKHQIREILDNIEDSNGC